MNIEEILTTITKDLNLSLDSERAKAYRKCIEYAEEKLSNSIKYNQFLKLAATELKQTPVFRNIVKELVSHPDKNSKLHLTYNETHGPCLTGNSSGLKYLSEIITNLSNSNLNREHINLYDEEFPMHGDSYPITIYLEDDNWFKNHAINLTEKNTEEPQKIAEKNLNTKQLLAFLTVVEPPPTMPITANKIYKILSFEPYKDQKVWSKNIRGSKERMYVFTYINDDGVEDKFAFDIDDRAIIIFDKKEYFEQIINKFS